MIAKKIAIGLFALSAIISLYKAGKYANGGKDVIEGDSAAICKGIDFLICSTLAIALYLNV